MKLKIKSESDKLKSQYIIFNILQILATLACIATFVFFIIMGVRLLVNSLYVAAASQDVYIEAPEKMIGRQVTFLDRYVTRYNIGNGRYAAGDYDSAVNNYEKALSEGILGGRKCKTCVNLALSRTKTIDFETIYSEFGKFKKGQDIDREALINQIKDAIGVLEDAGEDLTANGCTGEEPDMSIPEEDRETARLLKEDIDKEIEELKKMLAELMQGGEGGDSQGDESQQGNSGSGKKNSQSGSGGTTSREESLRSSSAKLWKSRVKLRKITSGIRSRTARMKAVLTETIRMKTARAAKISRMAVLAKINKAAVADKATEMTKASPMRIR